MTEQIEQAAPVEAAVSEGTTPAPKWAPETETLARDWGWKAPDEWKGELPPGYIDDPERYVERYAKTPAVQKLQKDIEAARHEAEEKIRKIEVVTTRVLERERAAFKAELDRIKAEKLAAVETGDVEAYKAAERREEAVSRQMADDKPQESAVPDNHRAAIEQWSVGKSWFKADPIKTQAAVILYGQAQQNGLTDPKAILAYVDQNMANQFADLRPKAAQPALVDGGLTFGGGSQASAFEKLPKEAKDAFRRFVEKGVFKDTKEDRAQYAEDYDAA